MTLLHPRLLSSMVADIPTLHAKHLQRPQLTRSVTHQDSIFDISCCCVVVQCRTTFQQVLGYGHYTYTALLPAQEAPSDLWLTSFAPQFLS